MFYKYRLILLCMESDFYFFLLITAELWWLVTRSNELALSRSQLLSFHFVFYSVFFFSPARAGRLYTEKKNQLISFGTIHHRQLTQSHRNAEFALKPLEEKERKKERKKEELSMIIIIYI
jgi:hypothetical protein